MKHRFAVWAAIFLLAAGSAAAQGVPNYLNYQGYLTGQDGTPLPSGLYTLEFNLYSVPDAGSPVWGPIILDGANTDGHKAKAQVALGRFNVILGPTDTAARDLRAAFTPGGNLFVGIKVNGGAEIVPRQQVLTAPYAFHAATSDAVGGDRLTFDPATQDINVGGGNINLSGAGKLKFADGTTISTDPSLSVTRLNDALWSPPAGGFPAGAIQIDAQGAVGINGVADTFALYVHGESLLGGRVNVGVLGRNNISDTDFLFAGNMTGASGRIWNFGTGDADVLELQLRSIDVPTTNNDFIIFKGKSATTLGAIQGNGAGSVVLAGAGNDYAEWMERINFDDKFEPGDVVGVVAGRIARFAGAPARPMVVSTSPIVLGNYPGDDALTPKGDVVAFIGQAPVKTRGAVAVGDYLVASETGEGAAQAVSPDKLDAAQLPLVLGRAWEASSEPGVKKIRAVIGQPVADDVVGRMAAEVKALRGEQAATAVRVEKLEAEVAELRGVKAQLAAMQETLRQLAAKGSISKLTSGAE